MKFTEKNNFIVKHTSKDHFYKDQELFKVHCPNSRIHADLKRVNSFNRKKLDGLMLWELLDKVSPEDILKNREEKPAEIIIENIDQAKEILIKMEIDPEKVSDQFLSDSIGKAAIAFESIMETLKPLLIGENKILTLSVPPSDVDSTPIDSIEGVKQFLIGVFSDADEIPEEFISKLVGKTKEEILMAIDFVKMYASITNKNDGLSAKTGTETSQDVSGTTESEGSEVQSSNNNPENGNNTDGISDGETVSELEIKNSPGTGEDVSGISEEGKPSEEGSIDNNASDESTLTQEIEEKAKELEEKEEELTDKELELEEKEESLEEKAQELEDKEKELSEKEAELEKTSPKKKEANKRNSRK